MAKVATFIALDASDEEIDAFLAALNEEDVTRYSPDQPRDSHGRFGGGDGSVAQIDPYEGAKVSQGKQTALSTFTKETGITSEVLDKNTEATLSNTTAQEMSDGVKWYNDAHDFNQKLADSSGMSLEQTTGITAALSPMCRWSFNETSSNKVADLVTGRDEVKSITIDNGLADHLRSKGLDPANYNGVEKQFAGKNFVGTTDVAKMPADLLAKTYPGGLRRFGQMYDANWTKAIQIAHGASPDQVLGGRKVRSFYNNMGDPEHSESVTIDRHMLNAMSGQKGFAASTHATQVFGNRAIYKMFSDSVVRAAKAHNLAPLKVQAAVWVHQRGSGD